MKNNINSVTEYKDFRKNKTRSIVALNFKERIIRYMSRENGNVTTVKIIK